MAASSQNTKRILFLINSFAVGGAERVFLSQISELHARRWEVHVMTLFSPGPLAGTLIIPKDHVVNLAASSVFDIGAVRRLVRHVRSLKPDILYTTLNEANTAGRITRVCCPRISLYTRESNMADIKPLLYKIVDVLLGFTSHTIVAVSHAVADSIAAHAPWLKGRMRVLYNGVRVPAEITTHAPAVTVRLLSVASLTPKKAQGILIDAMAKLPAKFTLTIAGSGALHAQLEDRVAKLGLGGRITFLGAVAPEQVEELYRTHDVFVLPSEREGCPNVVSEAQSFALPVVAFAIPGMREFVDESCGVLVAQRTPEALAQGIQEICASSERMKALGENGYRYVQKTREYARQLEALISLFLSAR